MMDEKKFWELIAESRRRALAAKKGDSRDEVLDLQIPILTGLLQEMEPAEIIAFNDRFYDLHNSAYRWKIWGAAFWMYGGCSDDGVSDFRDTLISLGEERFKQILKDPDSLAEIVDQPNVPYLQTQGFGGLAHIAYYAKTGKDIPYSNRVRDSADELGENWDFEDIEETREHLPRLVVRFPEMGD